MSESLGRWARAFKSYDRLADICVPRALVGHDSAEGRRARTLVWLCWAIAGAALALGLGFFGYGFETIAKTQLVGAAAASLFPFLLRATGSVDLVARGLLTLVTVAFSILALNQGGIGAPPAVALALAPTVAAMLMKPKEVLFWTGLVVAAMLVLFGLDTGGAPSTPAVLPPALSLIRSVAVTLLGTFVAFILQASSRSAFEALAKSEAKARALVDAIPDKVVRLDRQGRALDEGSSVAWPDGAPALTQRLDEVLTTGLAQSFEQSGPDRTFEVRLAPIDRETAIMMVRDVTDRRAMEAALIRAERERLEAVTAERLARTEKLAALGRVAAGIAHEINNPLTYVLANVGFVREELSHSSPANPELDEVLGEALEGAVRVKQIVAGLQVFGRSETSAPEVVDPNAALDAAIRMTSNEIRHRARLQRQQSPVPSARLPPGRLEQVLINLLANAAQSIPIGRADENEITVVTSVHPKGGTLIEVTDTGTGIPADQLARVTEPFFTTKPIGQGVGLGLSISMGIIEEAGGELWLESETGRGTSAFVRLPAAAPTVEAIPINPPVTGIRRLRILVVDDEDLVVRAIERLLTEHDLVTVSTGREACSRLTTDQAFDVVLCDLMMPDQTGMDVYRHAEGINPALAARFVFMSGGVLSTSASDFSVRFLETMLTKPFDGQQLRTAISRIIKDEPTLRNGGPSPPTR